MLLVQIILLSSFFFSCCSALFFNCWRKSLQPASVQIPCQSFITLFCRWECGLVGSDFNTRFSRRHVFSLLFHYLFKCPTTLQCFNVSSLLRLPGGADRYWVICTIVDRLASTFSVFEISDRIQWPNCLLVFHYQMTDHVFFCTQ